MAHTAVGLDGTRGGWVAVVLDGDRVAEVRVVTDLASALADIADAPVGIDIPVGLLDLPRRSADVAARSRITHTASSVFAAPCRTVVDGYRAGQVGDHATANALSRRVTGAGLSVQTWHIVDKIAEADEAVEAGADLREVHPELAFHLRAAEPLASKRSWNGVMARLAILRALGIVLPDRVPGADRLPPDDVFDAAIVAWTIAGLHRPGGLVGHPDPPVEWDRGRPVVIWSRP